MRADRIEPEQEKRSQQGAEGKQRVDQIEEGRVVMRQFVDHAVSVVDTGAARETCHEERREQNHRLTGGQHEQESHRGQHGEREITALASEEQGEEAGDQTDRDVSEVVDRDKDTAEGISQSVLLAHGRQKGADQNRAESENEKIKDDDQNRIPVSGGERRESIHTYSRPFLMSQDL